MEAEIVIYNIVAMSIGIVTILISTGLENLEKVNVTIRKRIVKTILLYVTLVVIGIMMKVEPISIVLDIMFLVICLISYGVNFGLSKLEK